MRTEGLIPTAIVLLIFLSWPAVASAQDLRGYAGGSFAMSPWRPGDATGGTPSTSYKNVGDGTNVVSVVGEGGWFYTRAVALGVEVTLPLQRNDLTQQFNYLFSPHVRISSYREQTFLGVVRYRIGVSNRVSVDVAGGGGVVAQSSLQQRAAIISFSPLTLTPFSEETEKTRLVPGVTYGADLAIAATRRVQVVPEFRILTVLRGNIHDDPDFASFGLPTSTWRLGIGLRVRF